MDKLDKIQHMHSIFKHRRTPITNQELAEECECSTKTIERLIVVLRDRWNAPLINISRRGWLYDDPEQTFELPGLWLTSEELIRLNSLLKLSKELDNDLFDEHLEIIEKQIQTIMQANNIKLSELANKIKIISTIRYPINKKVFDVIQAALIKEKQIEIHYTDYTGKSTKRIISPLQSVHYQENWYIDAYCHLRQALRQFKLANISQVTPLNKKAKKVSQQIINEHYASSYGIFAGKAKHTAKLKFTHPAAREAANLQWHPEQQGEWQGENYLLSFPYNDHRELTRNILKYGDRVEVLAPAKLKNTIVIAAQAIVANYKENF